jgi:hypothetical protein
MIRGLLVDVKLKHLLAAFWTVQVGGVSGGCTPQLSWLAWGFLVHGLLGEVFIPRKGSVQSIKELRSITSADPNPK